MRIWYYSSLLQLLYGTEREMFCSHLLPSVYRRWGESCKWQRGIIDEYLLASDERSK